MGITPLRRLLNLTWVHCRNCHVPVQNRKGPSSGLVEVGHWPVRPSARRSRRPVELPLRLQGSMEDMMGKITEMANAVVGLSASHRYVSEETSKNHRTEVKHLENIAWQIAGSGKNVNTSLAASFRRSTTK